MLSLKDILILIKDEHSFRNRMNKAVGISKRINIVYQ